MKLLNSAKPVRECAKLRKVWSFARCLFQDSDKWIIINNIDLNIVTVLCVIEEGDPIIDRCGDYELMTTKTDSDKPCIKVHFSPGDSRT